MNLESEARGTAVTVTLPFWERIQWFLPQIAIFSVLVPRGHDFFLTYPRGVYYHRVKRNGRMNPITAPKTTHKENLIRLRRIEGQVKGIQKMVVEEQYCIDIVNQIHAVINALYRASERILVKHIENCVLNAFQGKSRQAQSQKLNEISALIKRLHKLP